MSKQQDILKWLATGQTGISSETMAFVSVGLERGHQSHPSDPADFNRCLLLVEQVPKVKESFPQIRQISKEWAAIIDHWDELEAMFVSEAGRNWSKTRNAPETFHRMREILTGKSASENASDFHVSISLKN